MEQLKARYYDNETKEYYDSEAAKAGVRQERERKKRIAKEVGETATRDEKLKDIDEILDEIDEVLEENAETFVSSYIQKGGQ